MNSWHSGNMAEPISICGTHTCTRDQGFSESVRPQDNFTHKKSKAGSEVSFIWRFHRKIRVLSIHTYIIHGDQNSLRAILGHGVSATPVIP